MKEWYSKHKKAIIKNLFFGKALSCAELSEDIGKSIPLTTSILTSLISDGKVVETGFAASTGGRRPQLYSLKKDVLYTVAVAMDQFYTRIAIMDMHNNYVVEVEKIELPLLRNDNALSILIESISLVIEKSGINRKNIAGVGIGMPGFVNAIKGINHTYLLLENGGSISSYINNFIKLPVFVDNDSSLIALAELKFGSVKNHKNAMVVNLGWGIGLGMILSGNLFRGHLGFAGELSHIPLFVNGKLCSCGKAGCLETEASLDALIYKAIECLKAGQLSSIKLDQISPNKLESSCEHIIDAARRGDQFAIKLFSEAGYDIGRGIAILIHLLNPELIVLSGRGSLAGKIWEAPIQNALNENCIPLLFEHTDIKMSLLGYHAELIGASALVMENFENASSNILIPTETEKV